MSFSIVLMRNNSPTNYVSKSISTVSTLNGTLKDGTSILSPTIIIESASASSVITNSNYAYIQVFGRYYYITDVTSVNNGLWELDLAVDVLMTYANTIRQQIAVVSRQENKRNMYLDDGWFMAYQNPIVQQKYFSNATPFESQEYVLIIAGS